MNATRRASRDDKASPLLVSRAAHRLFISYSPLQRGLDAFVGLDAARGHANRYAAGFKGRTRDWSQRAAGRVDRISANAVGARDL